MELEVLIGTDTLSSTCVHLQVLLTEMEKNNGQPNHSEYFCASIMVLKYNIPLKEAEFLVWTAVSSCGAWNTHNTSGEPQCSAHKSTSNPVSERLKELSSMAKDGTIWASVKIRKGFPVAQTVKNLPAMQETRVRSLGQEDTLEKGMAIHSTTLAWIR